MLTTTIMRDSTVGDDWIRQSVQLNPVQFLLDEKTGQPTRTILSGPVRLSFIDGLLQPAKKMKTDPNSKEGYFSTILLPPIADLTPFWTEFYRVAASDFQQYYNASLQNYVGIDNFDAVVRKCEEKPQFSGYTPGGRFIMLSSNYKPAVVDQRGNPVTNPAMVHAGVWAIVACNCYPSGKMQPRKGPRFGLQTVMLIGDDSNLGGGGLSAQTAFKGVNVQPPMAAPAGAFAPPPAPGAPQAGAAAIGQFYGGAPAGAPPMPPMPAPAPVIGYPQTYEPLDLSEFT